MKKSIITMLLLTSASAFANEAADEQMNRAAFAGERIRAEVKAELQRAQREGTLITSDYASYAVKTSTESARVRSDVRAEAIQAARTHIAHELY